MDDDTKEINHDYIKGLNAAWFALRTLNNRGYDIDTWLEECTPEDAIEEASKAISSEAEEKYGIRVSFEEAWCEKPKENYINPLEKRMTLKSPKPIESFKSLKSYGGLKVGCEVYDTSVNDYAIIDSIHRNVGVFVVLTNGYTIWTNIPSNIISTTFENETVEDLHTHDYRRGHDHVIQIGDIIRILKVPNGCASINVGSYQVVDDHMCNICYVYDKNDRKWEFTEDMYKLMT